jgi:hypothetical protein
MTPQKLALDWIEDAAREEELANLTAANDPNEEENRFQLLQVYSLLVVHYSLGFTDADLKGIDGLDPCGKIDPIPDPNPRPQDNYLYPSVFSCDGDEKKVTEFEIGKFTCLNGLVLIIHDATLDQNHLLTIRLLFLQTTTISRISQVPFRQRLDFLPTWSLLTYVVSSS